MEDTMQSEWWTTFFTGSYFDVYKDIHTEETTRPEVDVLEQLLRLPVQGHLLDVPCGNGRHALEFARRGYVVSGVDISQSLLDQARQEAESAHLRTAWHHRDMRDLPWPQTFDGAVCLWGSFGYFDDEGNRAFVEAVARALKPGGRFVLETPIVESLFRYFHQNERSWEQRGDVIWLKELRYDFSQSQLERRWTYVKANEPIQQQQIFTRLYTYLELC